MDNKPMSYWQLAEQTARLLTANHENWKAFLTTSARLYKYSYLDQLMIYAQRPEATACAGYDLWNKTMGRYVRRGAKGIALLDMSGDALKLHYVFDVADTGARKRSRDLNIWQLTQDNEHVVRQTLQEAFDVQPHQGLAQQIHTLSEQLAFMYWQSNQQDILDIVDGSFLEEYDELNISTSFRNAVSVSLEYALLSRCGIATDGRFGHEDFMPIYEWNTPAAVAALGDAVSAMSENVLRLIEMDIRAFERSQNHERTEIHDERRLPDSEPDAGQRSESPAAGQVWQDAQDLSEGASPGAVEQPDSEREARQPSEGDRPDGADADRADDAGTGDAGERDGSAERNRPDDVGAADEQPQSAGRRSDPDGADLQLNFFDTEQTSLFPTEAQQIEQIDEAEGRSPFASFFSQEEVDHLLRVGSNEHAARMQIVAAFSKGQPLETETAFLRSIYRYGHGIKVGNRQIAAWYTEDGIRMAKGDAARYNRWAQTLSWQDAAGRIHELLEAGQFATNVELVEAAGNERMQLARKLSYLRGDLSEEGRAQGYLSTLTRIGTHTYPAAEEEIAQMLADPAQRAQIIREMEQFCAAYRENRNLLRFHYHRPSALLERIKALNLPHREFQSEMADIPWVNEFITEDQIRADIAVGSNFEGTKQRIYGFFTQPHTPKEKTDFLKKEYGVGGRAPARALGDHSSADHDTKGLHYRKAGCPDIHLSWNEVIRRIEDMIRKDQYLTAEGQAAWTVQQEAREEPETMQDEQNEQEEFLGFDTDYVRERLAESGIVGGEVINQELFENDPFIQQVHADAARIEEEQAQLHTETVAVYPGKKNGLPYDVVIQTIKTEEPEHTVQPAETKLSFPQIEPQPVENFRITDDHLGEGGAKTKYGYNVAAIRTLKQLESEGRMATPEEQVILSRYVGWGGVADAFDDRKPAWANEYAELKALLTPDEYAAARSSTLNAHYTSPTVIRAIYEAIGNMGFETGNVLEPAMGVGNFFGLLPESMQDSRLYGVELDSITGRIAKQLYPKANITISGFEKTKRQDFFDLAVGNVPFGSYAVRDKAYDRYNFFIHDYFFAKSLEQVRPGGVIAYITSKGTLDKANPDVRKYIARRAELLGAIRLPNTAFKANAGTEVTCDILFLQKRDRPVELEPDWVHLGKTADGVPVNSYYIEHPEMILGRMVWDKSMYGNEKETACFPIEGANLADQLHEAVQHIQGRYQEAALPDIGEGEPVDTSIPADPDVKNYSYTIVDGEVYFRENSRMVRPELNATAKERIKGLVALRECVHQLIDAQLNEHSDEEIAQLQEKMNALYDAFSAKYGLINDRANRLAFADDSSYYLLCSLEVLDDEGKLKRKADMFVKRTIRQQVAVEHVDTAVEALAVSIGERARVDIPFMARLMDAEEEKVVSDLAGVIFRLPDSPNDAQQYVTADEYLSGNVRQKLREAKRIAEHNPAFGVNVTALEAVQPKDLEASEIDVRLGATWIAPEYIQQFMVELLKTPYHLRNYIEVHYSQHTAEWRITGKSTVGTNDIAAYTTYGTMRANAYKILEDTLNLRDVRVYDTIEDADGKKRVLNEKETTIAQQKQQAIKDAFREWIWKDPVRRQQLVAQYNEQFNSVRLREYDGSHITFNGMNPEIALREHQRNAVAHVLYGGNTLLAHEVGAGKTFEMIAAAMESKRLGLCRKSMFIVPNHLTEQWSSEFLRLYPSANVLVTTKKDFEKSRRKKFCGRIATGDYDAVIIGHSQFEKIPISFERQAQLLQDQIQELIEGIEEVKRSHGEQFTIKQMERSKKQLEAKLTKLTADWKKDDMITFEELGVDRLFVDEAHAFKNMFLFTKMRNVAGLSTSEAQKSTDMFLKCRYLDEITGGRGVVFATGTPVSNSMVEMYTMQRYLQYDALQRSGLIHFDAWASTFGETTTAIELAPEGTGYRARTRFAKFFNLPELMTMFKEIADIKMADQLNLPTPEPHFETIVVKPTEIQQEMVQSLSERAAAVHSGSVDPSIDNMLTITSDGRKLGLDQRLINPLLPDDPGSKLNACVGNVFRIWDENRERRLTQLLFCDISTPKEDSFNVYTDIRSKLVDRGIPNEEIAFIHDADTEAKKKELFAKVRTGKVRVLLGSTQKMGAGSNVQDLLIAVHHLDVGWRPSDMTQRNGRIIRQGNQNKDVHIFQYVTEGTFDAYLYQTLENKQRFISQVMTSKSPVRSCDDVDEQVLSYAEIKALCAGDERIKEKMDLDVDVARLKMMKADHQSKQHRLEDQIIRAFPEAIQQQNAMVAGFEKDIQIRDAHPLPDKDFVGIQIRGTLFHDKEKAGEALLAACKDAVPNKQMPLGEYRGFAMSLEYDSFNKAVLLWLRGDLMHRVELGTDARGNLTRIENALAGIERKLSTSQARLDNLRQQMDAAKAEAGKPFPQEAELRKKSMRLAELDASLNIDKPKQQEQKRERSSVLESLRNAPRRPATARYVDRECEVR